jgi:energy-coupling factor transporter transmembrane protein EcfT
MNPHKNEAYGLVMNEDKNPLKDLPKVQRFQLMVVLSIMWTTIFSLSIGSWLWWGELVVGHVAVAIGILITGLTFRHARSATAEPARSDVNRSQG